MYRCAGCGKPSLICGFCDRGQIYCAAGCSAQVRRESVRRAGQKYQRSFFGRYKHAARQARYRRRQKQKVTHQGPPDQSVFVKPSLATQKTQMAKEDSDVSVRPVPELPVASMRALAPQTEAPPPSPQATSPDGAFAHVCHFCDSIRSPYLRRQKLVQLRRTKRHRPP